MPERSGADGLVLAADATLAELDWLTAEAWAQIMHRLPGSVLLLRNYDFEAPDNLAMIDQRRANLFGFEYVCRVSAFSRDYGKHERDNGYDDVQRFARHSGGFIRSPDSVLNVGAIGQTVNSHHKSLIRIDHDEA